MFKIQDDTYIKRALKFLIVALLIFSITFILAIIFSPSLENLKTLSTNESPVLSKATGIQKFWQYILNNAFRVPSQMLLLCVVPVPFLYYINIIITSILPGIFLGFAIHIDLYQGSMVFIASLPHIVLELLGLCFIASGLYKINQSIIRKISNIFRKNKKQNLSLQLAIVNLLKIYVFIALPLIILAAFFENYVFVALIKLLT